MNECKFSTTILVDYLEKMLNMQKAPMSPELGDHIKHCHICTRLVKDERMARTFVNFFNKQQKFAESSARLPKSPSSILPGQIWRFFFGSEKQSEFCLITSQPFKASPELDTAIRITPLFLSPNPRELDKSDILVAACKSKLGVPILVESWNERPILSRQLMEYFGELDSENFAHVMQAFQSDTIRKISQTVRIFRQQEISRGALFSDLVFNQLGDREAFEHYAIESNGIKLVYKKLGELIKTVFQPILQPITINEPQAIFAASNPPANEFLNKLYQILCDFTANEQPLPFRVRRLADNSFKLQHIDKKEFSFTLTTINNDSFSLASEKGTCHLTHERRYASLKLEEVSTITFEEIL